MAAATPPTRRSADRRESILAAADRIVRRLGPDASMSSIAAEAGVSKPIIYRHFGDKGGLYRALGERYTGLLLPRLLAAVRERDRRARTRAVIDAYLAAIEDEPRVYRFLMHRATQEEPTVTGLVASFARRVADTLAHGIVRELAADDDEERMHARARAWAFGMVGAVQAAGEWWLDERPVPRAQLADDLTDLLWGAWGAGG